MARSKRLNPLDASWLAVDSLDTPMHVGSLLIFSLPDDAGPDFMRRLVTHLKSTTDFASPWNLKLRSTALRRVLPAWQVDDDIDIDFHVRHSALPAPGGEVELGRLVSRLHSRQLDFSRPLWECTIIEGLENKRFAMYTKMHHSLVDGVSGMRMLQRVLVTSPGARKQPAPWAARPARVEPAEPAAPEDQASTGGVVNSVMEMVRKQAQSVPEVGRALARLANSGDKELTAPFSAPVSMLNGRVSGARRFATQQYELKQLKALAKAGDATLNDVVLWLCSTALRKFLKDSNALPARSLTAGIPVNVRPADDQGHGTAISFIMANLATDIADGRKRLKAITASTASAKDHLQSLPRAALTQYTMLVMAPYILQLLTGLGGRTRPVFNITISNVPGPSETLYFNGAKLEAMYPVSLLSHGQAINITCVSYAGSVNFGFTGARDTLPHMQNLAVYTGEALLELERILSR